MVIQVMLLPNKEVVEVSSLSSTHVHGPIVGVLLSSDTGLPVGTPLYLGTDGYLHPDGTLQTLFEPSEEPAPEAPNEAIEPAEMESLSDYGDGSRWDEI